MSKKSIESKFLGLIVVYGSVDGHFWNTWQLLLTFVFVSLFGLLNALMVYNPYSLSNASALCSVDEAVRITYSTCLVDG